MTWTRVLFLLPFLVGIGVGVLLHSPDMTGNYPSERELPADFEASKSDQLDRSSIAAVHAIKGKYRICQEIVAGCCTLREAALFFRILDEMNPSFDQKHFETCYPGRSTEERFCREVVVWMKDRELKKGGAQARQAREQLEAELSHLLQGGNEPRNQR
jgi:hypothetical protein